jgi:hypothetical protein
VSGRATATPLCGAKALKVIANSTSYGIYAQMTRRELGPDLTEQLSVYGCRDEPHTWAVAAPEEPGEYAFPTLTEKVFRRIPSGMGGGNVKVRRRDASCVDAAGSPEGESGSELRTTKRGHQWIARVAEQLDRLL